MRAAFLFSPLLLLYSCGSFRTVKVPPPPGPIPARIPEQVSAAPVPRKPLPDPPPLPADMTPEPEQHAVAIDVDLPSTPKPLPPKPRPRASIKQKAAPPAPPVAPTEVAEAAPMIQLGQLVPAAERSELLRETEELLTYCDHSMEVASRHSLTAAQSELLHRIRSLAHQSRELRERNPVEAKNLAERAKLFAGGLLMDLQ